MTENIYANGMIDNTYHVIGEHNWKDNNNVTGLYELQYQYEILKDEWRVCPEWEYHYLPSPKRIIAVSLPIVTKGVQDKEVGIRWRNFMGIGCMMAKIEYWTSRYEFSFQFWGQYGHNVYINKDDVEIASFGGEDTIEKILVRTIEWCEKSNPRLKYPQGIVATHDDI